MTQHDESEICLIQIDYNDSFNTDRVNFYGVGAWPTIAGNGVNDVWPVSCMEADYEANVAIPSPLMILLSEEGFGIFTATITAEENIVGASFFMAVTLDEEVPSATGMSRLPHHVKTFLTPTSGDSFTLMAGESVDISYTFEVQPEWDYSLMGVAAWVSQSGGVNNSPDCSYGDLANKNEVLNSRWAPTGNTVTTDRVSWDNVKSLYR